MPYTINLRKKQEKNKPRALIEKSTPPPIPIKPPEKEIVSTMPPVNSNESRKTISWEAPSFHHNPQKKYIAIMAIIFLCGAGAVIFYLADILTAIMLILSFIVLILYANKKPSLIKITVNQGGIIIDDRNYFYKELKSFWIDYNIDGPKELSLEFKKWYIPYVQISIEDESPVELRSLMINFIPEKEHEKSLADIISRKIGL